MIRARRDELAGIHGAMAVLMGKPQSGEKVAKINALQDRLEFHLKQYELQLLTEKVNIYGEVKRILSKMIDAKTAKSIRESEAGKALIKHLIGVVLTRLRDRQRQYARKPARCQRMIVSGRTISTAPSTEGNNR